MGSLNQLTFATDRFNIRIVVAEFFLCSFRLIRFRRSYNSWPCHKLRLPWRNFKNFTIIHTLRQNKKTTTMLSLCFYIRLMETNNKPAASKCLLHLFLFFWLLQRSREKMNSQAADVDDSIHRKRYDDDQRRINLLARNFASDKHVRLSTFSVVVASLPSIHDQQRGNQWNRKQNLS